MPQKSLIWLHSLRSFRQIVIKYHSTVLLSIAGWFLLVQTRGTPSRESEPIFSPNPEGLKFVLIKSDINIFLLSVCLPYMTQFITVDYHFTNVYLSIVTLPIPYKRMNHKMMQTIPINIGQLHHSAISSNGYKRNIDLVCCSLCDIANDPSWL